MDNIPFNQLHEAIEEFKRPSKNPQDIEEDILADLVKVPGWKYLKQRIEDSINNLKELSELKESDLNDVQLVGFKFLASRVAIAKLQQIIDIVELSAQVKSKRNE